MEREGRSYSGWITILADSMSPVRTSAGAEVLATS